MEPEENCQGKTLITADTKVGSAPHGSNETPMAQLRLLFVDLFLDALIRWSYAGQIKASEIQLDSRATVCLIYVS